MQAIVTKRLGPTNNKGARVKAKCQASSVTVPWDFGLGIADNCDKAARVLAFKLGWEVGAYGKLVRGELPDGNNCYVFVK